MEHKFKVGDEIVRDLDSNGIGEVSGSRDMSSSLLKDTIYCIKRR
jgi:hypothetical protein